MTMRTTTGDFRSLNRQFVAGSIALLTIVAIAMPASSARAQTTAPTGPMTVPSGQVPQPAEGGVNWEGVGYGVGTFAADIFYVPAKLVYAISGGLIGGGAYVLTGGNRQTAETIWRSSLGGDYVVTPDMLAGKQPIHFAGPTETAPIPPDATVQPVTSAPAPSGSLPEYSATSSQGSRTTASR